MIKLSKYKTQAVSGIVFIGLFGAFLGNLNNYPAFLNHLIPKNIDELNLHGIWLSKYSYPINGGTLEVHGTTEYFKNNHYNFIGEIGVTITSGDNTIYILYNAEGTGEWQTDLQSLTIRLDDMVSWPKALSYNGTHIDSSILKSKTVKKVPKLEEIINTGINDEFKIINFSEEKFVLKADAPNGEIFEIVMIKQTKRFQR